MYGVVVCDNMVVFVLLFDILGWMICDLNMLIKVVNVCIESVI